MSSSQEVFRLRREGQIDTALAMARERMAAPDGDDWDLRAYMWCLIDLVKMNTRQGAADAAAYGQELRGLTPPADDDVLIKQYKAALSLLQEGSADLMKAKELSKAGHLRDAIAIYGDLARGGLLDRDNGTSYGWDLYNASKDWFGQTAPENLPAAVVQEVRRNLNAYLKLDVERPARLHSCMLGLAQKLASADHLRLLPFVRLWGLENLLTTDIERFTTEDGKTLSSLAEKVAMRTAKEAAEAGNHTDIEWILPFVDSLILRCPDNDWLTLAKVKLLRALGRQEEARTLAISFAKIKAREYWAWELLGELQAEHRLRLACYCKALTCSQDDNFVSPLRLKLAQELLEAGYPGEAKGELAHVMDHKARAGHRVPPEIQRMASEAWFASAEAILPKPSFYAGLAGAAEDLLFADLPWLDACAGELSIVNGEAKPRSFRKLFLKTRSLPAEVSVAENRVTLRNLRPGMPIQIRADFDPGAARTFTLHAMSERPDGAPYDIFPVTLGVIDHVNRDRGLIHISAGQEVQGTLPIAEFKGPEAAGTFVKIKAATYHSRKGLGVRILAAEETDQVPEAQVCRQFRSGIRISNGMGFTDDNIFVPPDLVSSLGPESIHGVEGLAVRSLDKRKGTWGWKAVTIRKLLP